MTEIGKLYCAETGKIEEVHPHNGKKFTLAELQGFVRGNIEMVPLSKPFAFCNETGMLDDLPINFPATDAFNSLQRTGYHLRGDVIQVFKVRGRERGEKGT